MVGALIGSSGAFLTKVPIPIIISELLLSGRLTVQAYSLSQVMCDAMNRSLPNVILGGFGTPTGPAADATGVQEVRIHTEIDASGTAEALRNAEKIVIVPGYGMAVAQAG